MVLRSVAACMDSGDWLQGGGMQHSGFETPVEDMLSCPRPLMDRRLKPSTELALKCPRCDSSNTKFCYYNNYSLSQPRYFCKACRRYWTKGGSLRNVPVGGGCRKNKRFKRTPDPPVQTEQSAASAPAINNNNNNNEMNSCSPPGLDHSNLNLPAVPSVYFTLLNGGADGLGVAYANRSVPQQNHQALRVAAPSAGAADRPLMVGSCNSSSGIMEIQATATATATHQPLANLSNLNTFQSLKAAANLITSGGPEQSALLHVSGDLTSIFEAHHHQQVPTSSTPAISHVSDNRFHDVTLHNNRLNSGLINDQDVQWQHLQQNIVMPVEDHESGHVPLPFDHDDANAVEELRPHNDVKLRQLIINGVQDVQSPLGGEENRLSFNWQLPSAESEGLLDTSANNMSYWNGGAWPDLSCYAPYTNSLI